MTLTINLSDEQATALQAKAAAEGLSLEAWLQKLADQSPSAWRNQNVAGTVFERGLGLFGSPEDAALLDEVVSIAYDERRRPGQQ